VNERLTYRNAGVDVRRTNDALGRVREFIAQTNGAQVIGGIGDFGGLIRLAGYSRPVLVATTDGVGTKLELARLTNKHEVVGKDLVNHCVNDALAMGAEPLFFLDYFATGRLDPDVFERVVGAMAQACAAHQMSLLGGETAEMPGIYAEGIYDIAGFLVGVVEEEDLLRKTNVREGDHCFAFASSGLHTNGYTLARAIMARDAAAEGVDVTKWLNTPRSALAEDTAASALMQEHQSYLEPIKRLRKAAEVHAIAHITGGGWEGNIPRSLPDELGVVIDPTSFPRPRIFDFLADRGNVPDQERWDTWNMGIGLVAFVAQDDFDRARDAVPEAIRIGRVETARGERRVRFA